MNKTLRTITQAIIYSIIVISVSSKNLIAQTNIQTTGTSFVFLEKNIAIIEFNLKGNGTNVSSAENSLLNNLKKISVDSDSKLKVINKKFMGATSNPKQLVSGTPIQAIYDVILITPIATTSKMLDLLLSNPEVTIVKFSTRFSNKENDLKIAYADAVSNAKEKAEQIAKSNNLTLGKIQEIVITEEAPPSSIRAQLESSPEDIDSGPTEIRIFANVRFEFKNKDLNPSNTPTTNQ